MKTNKATAKRFSLTGTGKIKFKRAGLRHFMRRKSQSAKRKLGETGYLSPGDHNLVIRQLPYR